MRIIELVLHNYTRLLYVGISHFEYRPESPFQLILGTNGSGKSSIIAELSPLPAARQNYLLDGYKKVVVEHEGVLYTLLSEFKHGNKHTFIRGDEVLNNLGTGVLQKELVREHFNYTQETHDLETGVTRFTKMGPTQRRDVISRMGNNDVSYGLALFREYGVVRRELIGTRKNAEQRLALEESGILSEEEISDLEGRMRELTEQITQFMYQVDTNTPQLAVVEREYRELITTMGAVARDQIVRVDTEGLRGYGGIAQIHEQRVGLRTRLEYVSEALQVKRKEYADLEDTINQLSTAGGGDLSHINSDMVLLEHRLAETCKTRITFDYGDVVNYQFLAESYARVSLVLRERVLAMPLNKGRHINPDSLKALRVTIDELTTVKNIKTGEYGRLLARKEVITNSDKVECPKCLYVWVPGVSEVELSTIETKLGILVSQLEDINSNLGKNNALLDEYNDWRTAYADVYTLIRGTAGLECLWREFLIDDKIFEDPHACVRLMEEWDVQLQNLAERSRLEQELQLLRDVIKRAEVMAAGQGHQTLPDRLLSLESEISELNLQEAQYRRSLAEIDKIHSTAVAVTSAKEKLEILSEKLNAKVATMGAAIRNSLYSQEITIRQAELAQITNHLTEKKAAKAVVESLQITRDVMLDREKCVDIILDALSPTNGVIADQLTMGIDSMVEHINRFIEPIWTYDMKVMSCGVDGEGLDYKFPIHIKGFDKQPVPDVLNGSGAQRDVIDFAFVLVYRTHHGINNYPLHLDELGSTFDPEHRQKVVEFLKQLVDSQHASQIFYISHNKEAHTTLTHADICVVDDENIGYIEGANHHVVIA